MERLDGNDFDKSAEFMKAVYNGELHNVNSMLAAGCNPNMQSVIFRNITYK